jgi:hypothetical protein
MSSTDRYVALIGTFTPRESTFKPSNWAFSGGDGIRTHGLSIAKVWFSVF